MQDNIAEIFNTTTSTLITFIDKRVRTEAESADLDRLRQRIKLLKSTMGNTALIVAAAPFFIKYSDQILEEDIATREKFFLTINVRAEYLQHNQTIKREDEFIFAFTDSLKTLYQNAKQADKDEAYRLIKIMFQKCCEYELAK